MNYENKIKINNEQIAPITDVITLRNTEQRILNYMLLSLEKYNYVNSILKDDDFTFLAHEKIFQYLFKDNKHLPKETKLGRFDIKGLEEFIVLLARVLKKEENIRYSSTINILSKEPSLDIKKDLDLINHYSFEKDIALNKFKDDNAVIEVMHENLNSFTKAYYIHNRLCSVITSNIEKVPLSLCDTAMNTINFLETIDLNNSIYKVSFSPYDVEPIGITTFHIKENYSLLEERDNKEQESFKNLFEWAEKYKLEESIFPREIEKLLELKELNISNKQIEKLPKELVLLKNIYLLDLSFNKLKTLPKEFKEFTNLKLLNLEANEFENIPEAIFQMRALTFLTIKSNLITSIPSSISNLKKLRYLCICQNKIVKIPKEIKDLKDLEDFCMHRNKLEYLPETIGSLIKLTTLTFSNNYVEEIPQSIIILDNLESLEFENNKIEKIDLQILRLKKLNKLAFDEKLMLSIFEPIRTSKKFNTINLVESKIKEDSKPIKNLNFKIETESWIDKTDKRENGCIILKSTKEN